MCHGVTDATADINAIDAATEKLTEALRAARVLPVVRTATMHEAVEVCEALAAAGLPLLEVTTTVPSWLKAAASVARFPDTIMGVGTVTTVEQARAAVSIGAAFLVSPCGAPEVREVAELNGVPFLEGGMTPTEVIGSARKGIAKLFPAHVGGPAMLRDIMTVAPRSRIVPTGGIRLEDVPTWLAAGAVAVGVGSDLRPGPDLPDRLAAVLA